MKIIAISDLHGQLPEIKESADIMLIAGDISPLDIQRDEVFMEYWLKDTFLSWINTLAVEKVYLIAGNHDFYFERTPRKDILSLEHLSGDKLKYLENEVTTHTDSDEKTWSIFGTPYCHRFGFWPFMYTNDVLIEKFKDIPEEVDIIITHDPPYNINYHDSTLQKAVPQHVGWEPLGNKPLREQLEKTKFKLLCCGHIHSGNHEVTCFMGGQVVNVSLLDEYYNMTYNPCIIEL